MDNLNGWPKASTQTDLKTEDEAMICGIWEAGKCKETILIQGPQKGISPYLLGSFWLQFPMAVTKYLKRMNLKVASRVLVHSYLALWLALQWGDLAHHHKSV